MTKIKNTKKGMAKKTLSMSLVVAMLATSNVPVWAAEFSDGSDAVAVATEAPAAETFSDETAEAPVVEDTDATAAEATTNGTGFDITATDFTGITNNAIVWGNAVSTTVTVTKKADNTDTVNYYYVWKDNDGQITTETSLPANGQVSYTPGAAQSGKDITLFVYAKKGDTLVWSWTSDSFKVQPKQLSDVINMKSDTTKLKLKDTFKKTYTGKAIVPTVDDIDFTNLANTKDANNNAIFAASDFVIGSTEGDTVNVTTKGVNVYLTTTKAGYAGSVVINYTISPLALTTANVSDYLEATFVTTSKQYTGKNITLKNTDVKIVDKKSGVDLSSYVKDEDVIFISGANYIKAGTQFNTGKAGDADLTFPIATPTESKYKNYTITNGLTLKPTNSFSITKRDLSTVNVSIPEQAYQNGAIVTVAPSVATYTDKTTGEVLELAGDVVITSTATTQGVHDVTVSPATNNTNVEGSTTAKLSVAASSLSTAKFSGQSYAEQPEEYTGEQITKDLSKLGTVSITDVTGATTGTHNLVKDVDYKVEFGKNIDAGVGTVTIVGLGSYVGSTKTYTFTINPAVVDTKTVTVSKYVEKKDTTTPSDYKDAMGLVVKAKNANGKEFALTEGTDYVVEKYKFTTSADADTTTGEVDGKVKVVLKTTTKNGHKYLKNTNFIVKDGEDAIYSSTITKTTLKSENIKLKKTSYTYTGAAIEPEFDVVVDGRVINPEEYKIKSLTNNVNAGTATMVITGKDKTFTSKTDASVTFTIEAADASKLVGVVPSQVYTGYSIQPTIDSLTLNNVAINVKDNFTVTYGENVAMGEGTIILTPKNKNFTGTKTITFKITGQMLKGGDFKFYDANGLTTTLSHTYDGNAYAPAKTIFDTTSTSLTKSNGTTVTNPKLIEGTDYEIKYVDNVYGKKNVTDGKQYGIVLAIAKGTYAGNYNLNGVTDGIYTDASGNKIENVIYAEQFVINTLEIKNTNVSVANGIYAGGLPVKPVVVVNVGGKTLVEGTDYDLKYGANDDRTKVTTTKSLTVKIIPKNGYRLATTEAIKIGGYTIVPAKEIPIELNWGIDKFNLANADVTVDGDKVTVKCGRVDVETSEYTVEQKDGKVTVTAKKDSKNYTGSKTVDTATQDQKPGTPMISSVKVVGNKATAILSGDSEGAAGYDYVISTDRDCITNKDYDSINKNQVQTSTTFKYVQQGTYYAYCHAWKRDENGKKVFSDWSNAYPFVVSAITPDAPVITNVKVSGSTIKVTYKPAANATGYDVVLGTGSKKENGETRPYNYGAHKKLNLKEGTVTATFKNVPKGTWVVGMHAFNRTSEDGKKVFSPWSNLKKATVK